MPAPGPEVCPRKTGARACYFTRDVECTTVNATNDRKHTSVTTNATRRSILDTYALLFIFRAGAAPTRSKANNAETSWRKDVKRATGEFLFALRFRHPFRHHRGHCSETARLRSLPIRTKPVKREIRTREGGTNELDGQRGRVAREK